MVVGRDFAHAFVVEVVVVVRLRCFVVFFVCGREGSRQPSDIPRSMRWYRAIAWGQPYVTYGLKKHPISVTVLSIQY